MARYTTSFFSPRTPDEAWRFLSDIRLFSTWDPGVASSVQVKGDGPVVGAAYDLTIRGLMPTVMRYVVVERGERRLKMISTTPWLCSVDELSVEPDGEGARVTYDAVLTLNGPLGLLDPLLAIAFRRIGDRADVGLRQALGAASR